MDRPTIDWSTASVSRGSSGFDLKVELDGQVSPGWETLFARLAEEDSLRTHERGWSIVRLSERTITMERLEREARVSARAYLSDIVGRTNDAVAAKVDEEERERLRAEREAADLARAAEELAEWFRSDGGAPSGEPDTGAGELWPTDGRPDGNGDDVGRGDSSAGQAKGIRDRLARPFGGAGA